MNINSINKKARFTISLFLFLAVSSLGAIIENSIVPEMAKWESLENLSLKKYSRGQFFAITSSLAKVEEKIRVVSFNILFSHHDNKLDPVNRWPERFPRVVEAVREMDADVIGIQELYANQLADLSPFLDGTYTLYAKPCIDGELNGIYFRTEKFELLNGFVWYLSDTPEVPDTETLTMVHLKDLKTGKQFAVFNVHLSFSNPDKREFQARFIAEKIDAVAKTMQVVLTGDMNTFSNRPDMTKLPFYDGDYINQIFTKKHLSDAKSVSLLGHIGPIATFTNTEQSPKAFTGTGVPGIMLDHIFVTEGITVLLHAVQPGTVEGKFPSDHMPVLIDCLIN